MTIPRSTFLFDLQHNFEQHGLMHMSVCWVVGDKRRGKRFPELYRRIRNNNESRRNIGYFHALEYGCETLISLDDDNYSTNGDFLGCHIRTGLSLQVQPIEETSLFHNVCEYFEIEPRRKVFPRGFPFALRQNQNFPVTTPAPR
jgi:hypothetical protein